MAVAHYGTTGRNIDVLPRLLHYKPRTARLASVYKCHTDFNSTGRTSQLNCRFMKIAGTNINTSMIESTVIIFNPRACHGKYDLLSAIVESNSSELEPID